MDKYTDTRNDIPAPSDIITILSPTKPEVSKVQYMKAIEDHKKNGYDPFSYESGVIQAYEAQEADKQDEHREVSNELTKLAGNAVRRIT